LGWYLPCFSPLSPSWRGGDGIGTFLYLLWYLLYFYLQFFTAGFPVDYSPHQYG